MAYPLAFGGANSTPLETFDAKWVSHPSYSNAMVCYNSRAYCLGSSGPAARYYYNEAPASADYGVVCDVNIADVSANFDILARVSSSADTFYRLSYVWGDLKIHKRIAGTLTQVGSTLSAVGVTNGSVHEFELRCVGDKLSVWQNGSQIGSDVTDTSITAAGFGGFGFYDGYQGNASFDSFDVQAIGGATGAALDGAGAAVASGAGTLSSGSAALAGGGAAVASGTGTLSATGAALAGAGAGQATGTGALTVMLTLPAALRTLGNKNGGLWASQPTITIQVFDTTTGSLVKTIATSTNASGVLADVSWADASFVAGRAYALLPWVGTVATGTPGHAAVLLAA